MARGNSSARDIIQPICSVPPPEKIEELASDSFFLGMFDSASYESRAFRLDRGDILVVYSDGLTDAQNQREECSERKDSSSSSGKRRPREVTPSRRRS